MKGKFVEIDSHVRCNDRFGIVVSDKLEVPYIHDGSGCANYNQPEVNLDVDSWPTFEAYLIFTLPSGDIEVINKHSIEEVKITETFDGQMTSCSIFDHATSGLRYHLTLLDILKNMNPTYIKE